MRSSFIRIIVLLLSATVSNAQSNTSYTQASFTTPNRLERLRPLFPLIDSLYSNFASKNHVPGYSFGVVVDGKLVHTGNGGYSDLSTKTPATSNSMYRIASMSKSFTAMAILHLRDAGKLKLDDPVHQYIPAMKGQKLTSDAAEITIRELLTHSAGFPEDNPWGDRQLADTEEDLLKTIQQGILLSNTNGLQYEYSNLGFAMLGYIIHKVSGKSYGQYIREAIWQPLGMKEASWEYSEVPSTQLVKGYRWLNEQWEEQPMLHDGIYGAMGGMICSVESFSKYMSLHLAAWPPSNAIEQGPVKRSSIREMHQPWRFNGMNPQYKYPSGRPCSIVTAYGYGLRWSKDCEGRTTVGHSGGLPGFGSNWTILPELGIGIVFFTNVTYAPTSGFNNQVLDTLVRSAGLQAREISASSLLKNIQQKLSALLPHWNNAEKSGLFAENFFADNPIDQLRKTSKTLFNAIGPITGIGEITAQNQLRGSFIIQGEKGRLEVYFTIAPEQPGLIQEFNMKQLKP